MRVVFFSDNFRPECCPPATHVYERARLWVEQGHSVTVITTAPNFPEGKVFAGYRNDWRRVEDMDGIRVVRVKTYITRNEGFVKRILDYLSFMVSGFLFALLERKPDVVISTSPQLFTPAAGLAYATVRRVPHVFELRDLWPASIRATGAMKAGFLYRMLERFELLLYRRSARVVSFTQAFKTDLVRRGIAADKIEVVVSGANLELFSPRPRDPKIEAELGLRGRLVFGYLGTLGLAHDLENVAATARLLKDEPVTFLLVGAGADAEHVKEHAREWDLTNVVFVPRQPREAMPAYWSVCDVGMVHLKADDLFRTVIPSKLFECMAAGKPVLYVGPDGEAADIVRRHGMGQVVPPNDPHALRDAVRQVTADEQLRRTWAINSLAAAPEYSREKQAQGTLAVLQRALESRPIHRVCCLRRALDVAVALTLAPILAPVGLLVALAVRTSGKGPLLVREIGVGLHGREFALWRLRLPVRSNGPYGRPEVTLFGRFLRKYKLDRMPHLWNLLKGDVTLVGPRVRAPEEHTWLGAEGHALLLVTPGLVGPGTVRYRDVPDLLDRTGIAPGPNLGPVLSDAARVALEYSQRATLWTDLWLFSAAVLRVLFRGQFVAGVLRVLDPAKIGSLVLTDQEQLRMLRVTAFSHGEAAGGGE